MFEWFAFILVPDIERDEMKMKNEIKAAAKKGEKSAATAMAKGLVRSRRTKERMLLTKTHINSTILELKNNVGQWNKSEFIGLCCIIHSFCIFLFFVASHTKGVRRNAKELAGDASHESDDQCATDLREHAPDAVGNDEGWDDTVWKIIFAILTIFEFNHSCFNDSSQMIF